MNKETWCDRYLSEESPECLPLPDGREPGRWGRQALSLAVASDAAEFSASLLLLLGLYGGLQEGAFLLQQGERMRPVRLSWQGGGFSCRLHRTGARLAGGSRELCLAGGGNSGTAGLGAGPGADSLP